VVVVLGVWKLNVTYPLLVAGYLTAQGTVAAVVASKPASASGVAQVSPDVVVEEVVELDVWEN
jgi:hypothetical protein